MAADQLPELPRKEDGDTFDLEDYEALVEYLRWITPRSTAKMLAHYGPDGTHFEPAGGGGGGLIDVKITATISAAIWGAGAAGVTSEGAGTCRLMNSDGTVSTSDRPIFSWAPRSIEAPRYGKAERRNGKLYVVTAWCDLLPA